jgi:hypothetical protein
MPRISREDLLHNMKLLHEQGFSDDDIEEHIIEEGFNPSDFISTNDSGIPEAPLPLGGAADIPEPSFVGPPKPKPEIPEVNEFTLPEKLLSQTAVPIAGGIGGSLAGASTGAAIGTALLPGVGTAIGAGIGAIAGGAAGSAGGQALGDFIEPILGGKKRTGEEIKERALREAKTSAKIDAAFFGAGSIIKGGSKLLKGVSKEVIELKALKNIAKKSDLNQKKLGLKLIKIKSDAKDASIKIKNEFKTKKEFSEAISNKALNKLATFSDKEVTKLSKSLAQSSNKAQRSLGLEYDKIDKAFGKEPINIDSAVANLDGLSKSKDQLIFQSMTPISGLVEKLKSKTKNLVLKDAIALRRSLSSLN